MPLPILPRMSLMALLAITFFTTLVAIVIRFTGWIAVVVLVLFAPSVIGSVCGVMEWPSVRYAMRAIRGGLAIVALLVVSATVVMILLTHSYSWLGVGVGLGAFCLFFWPVQYTIIVESYE